MINNGAIFDGEDKLDGSDNASRDTTVERGSSYGPDGHSSSHSTDRPERVRTPRSVVSGSFTAINSASVPPTQPQHDSSAVPSPLVAAEHPRADGAPNDAGWRNVQTVTYPLQSPTQSSPYIIGASPLVNQMILGTLSNMPCLNNIEIMEYLDHTEHLSWSQVAGGPDALAHGSDSSELYLGQQGFWSMGSEMGLPQQVGTYD